MLALLLFSSITKALTLTLEEGINTAPEVTLLQEVISFMDTDLLLC